MNVRHPYGFLNLFSIKNIFHDKMDLKFFYFHATVKLFFIKLFLLNYFSFSCDYFHVTIKPSTATHQKFQREELMQF